MQDVDIVEELAIATMKAGGQREWARRNGVSFKWVNNVLNGHAKPSIGIANALGFRRVVMWERISPPTCPQ
jgi:lambda repressor-like predicted transcriptional regulator